MVIWAKCPYTALLRGSTHLTLQASPEWGSLQILQLRVSAAFPVPHTTIMYLHGREEPTPPVLSSVLTVGLYFCIACAVEDDRLWSCANVLKQLSLPSLCLPLALNSTPSLLSVHKEYSFNEWDYSKSC